MGASFSTTGSVQSAQADLAQRFSGTCNVQCQNIADNIDINLIDTTVAGGIDLTQTCATNGSCLINSMMDATSDIYFKAANSSGASNAADLFSWLNYDQAAAGSRQAISQDISQSSQQNCNIGSYNDYDNISIFAADSTIGGGITISQQGSTQGQCQLSNSMTAAAYATELANNNAQTGKQKKGQLTGDLSTATMLIIYAVVAIVVVVVAFIVGREVSKFFTPAQPVKPPTPNVQSTQSLIPNIPAPK